MLPFIPTFECPWNYKETKEMSKRKEIERSFARNMQEYILSTKHLLQKNYYLRDNNEDIIYIASPHFFRFGISFSIKDGKKCTLAKIKQVPFRFKAKVKVQSETEITKIEKEINFKKQIYEITSDKYSVSGDVSQLNYTIQRNNYKNNEKIAVIKAIKGQKHKYSVKVYKPEKLLEIFLIIMGLETVASITKY